ncbi:hypothetical protein [Suipraeoptans intestinalis]|uniref:hypothetical protein n=1 Tax=Suipraeoptans intestinalis TaxID=2606628 RepID=UPI002A75537F|nr:hypothetical protein [Suipraeoptans intestinalis]MDY3122448.1 hypothetical protein [Suipraeoptans intestinalis]
MTESVPRRVYELATKYLEINCLSGEDNLFQVSNSYVAIINFLFHVSKEYDISLETLIDGLAYDDMNLHRIAQIINSNNI